jgi:hypothetical protein
VATKAKRWPNNADWARLDCISLARQSRRLLTETLDDVDNPELLRRMARVMEALREIEIKLNSVGSRSENNESIDK